MAQGHHNKIKIYIKNSKKEMIIRINIIDKLGCEMEDGLNGCAVVTLWN